MPELRKRKEAPAPAAPQPAPTKKAKPGRPRRRQPEPEPVQEQVVSSEEEEEEGDEDEEGAEEGEEEEEDIDMGAIHAMPPKQRNATKNARNVDGSMISVNVNGHDDHEDQDDSSQNRYQEYLKNPDLKTRRQVMLESASELITGAQSLIDWLQVVGKSESIIWRHKLELRREQFQASIKRFRDVQSATHEPFLDLELVGNLSQDPDEQYKVAQVVRAAKYANMAIAMQMMDKFYDKSTYDDWPQFILSLDSFLPQILSPFGDDAANSEVALGFRMLRAIQTIPNKPNNKDEVYQRFAEIFCEIPETEGEEAVDYKTFLIQGPYKEISRAADEDLDDICQGGIMEIVSLMNKKGTRRFQGLDDLREKYEMAFIVGRLGDWLGDVYATAKGTEKPQPEVEIPGSVQAIEFGNEEEEEDESVAESQPIVRVDDPAAKSLFQDANTFNALGPDGPGPGPGPGAGPRRSLPSSRHPIVEEQPTPGSISSDNADLLGPRPSTTAASSTASSTRAAPVALPVLSGNPERQPSGNTVWVDNSSEEDDDDEFEQDTRPVNKERQAYVTSLLEKDRTPTQASKAPASAQALNPSSPPAPASAQAPFPSAPFAPARTASTSASMPPPPQPRNRYPSPPPASRPSQSSQPSPPQPTPPQSSFEALRQEKRLLSIAHRQTLSPPAMPKQRHAWSDNDSQTLITLIRERQASWTTIEKEDSEAFERPRGQQAYRDKARNMKVDMLLTDAILPPCFDMVTLGQKEIRRVVSFGKNPARRERDMDESGRAINTEYGMELS